MSSFPSRNKPPAKDLLWKNISELPYFRGLLRAVEGRYYQDIPLKPPVLDLGCGDGHFAEATFQPGFAVGIDPWLAPLREANQRKIYKSCLQAIGGSMPFPDRYFQTVISNSVLEHIPDLDPVLAEISRVLKPGGQMIFCVPNHRFLSSLSVSTFFSKIHLGFAAKGYQSFFNRISRHHHCEDSDTWNARLSKYGFSIDSYWHYFSKEAFHCLEWGHYFGLPSYIWKKLVNQWIIAPYRWNLAIPLSIVRKYFEEKQRPEDGVYSFYIAHKEQTLPVKWR